MKNVVSLLVVLGFIGCTSPQSNNDEVSPSWASHMQKTAKSLQQLLPYLYSKDKFEDPKNKKKISKKIENFKDSIHSISPLQAKKILGDDPYILRSLESMQELVERAHISHKRGDDKNARILLKATTNSCFKCHTRQNLGPERMQWGNLDVAGLKTDGLEKTHLLVSMRQYEKAKKTLVEFLAESEDQDQFDMHYERALHYYIMISLRGQDRLRPTLKFVQGKILVDKTPTRLHYTLKYWESDLRYWIKHQKQIQPNIASAKRVLRKNKQRYSDRNLINNIIASQILHQTLGAKTPKSQKAQSYQILGTIYDELVEEGFWDLPETYYEMCVRYAPKTKLAKKCYKSFKDNITLGYSGSRGTLIPSAEFARIEELRKLSGL